MVRRLKAIAEVESKPKITFFGLRIQNRSWMSRFLLINSEPWMVRRLKAIAKVESKPKITFFGLRIQNRSRMSRFLLIKKTPAQ